MYSVLQTRYQRVEKALDTLLESITAYNPSQSAADELVAADDHVNEALEQLSIHHANYARILSLRATSAALDAQLKSTLSSLATTRATLKSISLPAPTPTTPVTVAALLSYAKFISKTTVPPTRRREEPAAEAATVDNDETAATQGETSEAMRRVLPPEIKGQFIPWPGHEIIMHGGLAAVQSMRDAGNDPALITEETKQETTEVALAIQEETKPAILPAAAPVVAAEHVRHKEEDEFDPDEM